MPRLPRSLILGWIIAVATIYPSRAQKPTSNAPAASVKAIEALNYTEGKSHTTTLPNAVTLDLIWIPSGTFTIGSPRPKSGDSDGRPVHMVTISKGFWLGKMLLTQGQYQAMMGTNPSHFANVGADAPVESVTWYDAMEFCRKLTKQERAAGHLPKGYVFTLPTEAQWEYAYRAGTTGTIYGNLDDIAWYRDNSGDSTHPVGQKQPNAFGLYDMIGNVCEWCSDWFASDFSAENVTDPVGADSGTYRVFCGGCWQSSCGVSPVGRDGSEPGNRRDYLGFRLALAPSR